MSAPPPDAYGQNDPSRFRRSGPFGGPAPPADPSRFRGNEGFGMPGSNSYATADPRHTRGKSGGPGPDAYGKGQGRGPGPGPGQDAYTPPDTQYYRSEFGGQGPPGQEMYGPPHSA